MPEIPGFASRTAWNLEPNQLAVLAENLRLAGRPIIDLTESNPTRCGFQYEDASILTALSTPASMRYDPQPRGLQAARQAVAGYYAERNTPLSPERILLTSGSSEAYGHLFRLLTDPGDSVLIPEPGYPLFEFLSRLNDVELAAYSLEYHRHWEIDFASLEAAVRPRTRAVIVVNPNNPTGSILRARERREIVDFCRRRGLALIADEVFLDYCFPHAQAEAGSFAGENPALTFTLNGLSKSAALPQMKLGWIAISGPERAAEDALARLDVIADTYLAVGTPVQCALPQLLASAQGIQRQISVRTDANLSRLDEKIAGQSLCSRLEVDAGWSAIIRVPNIRSDEDWALELLDKDGVLVHPGHFFNFATEGYLVVSLLPPLAAFDEGICKLLTRVSTVVSPPK
jgi:alanine-synthesizing transaminase